MKKNENYLKYVQAMRMLDEGKSLNYIEKHLKTNRKSIKLARQRYLIGGELALLQPSHQVQLSQERKLAIVQEVEEKQLSLLEVALKHLVPPHSLQRWVKAYRQFGETRAYMTAVLLFLFISVPPLVARSMENVINKELPEISSGINLLTIGHLAAIFIGRKV